jgi:hypothetical protein
MTGNGLSPVTCLQTGNGLSPVTCLQKVLSSGFFCVVYFLRNPVEYFSFGAGRLMDENYNYLGMLQLLYNGWVFR